MEMAVPIDFEQAWAAAKRSVNERVVAEVEADDPWLLAPFKKLGEGGAPDVRHVASVGEAKRRAAGRAVVDNMKEAYMSVLAPSHLGVGISAGDSVLIHRARLIAEKLGQRAIIAHTDFRRAYNEVWCRTIIKRQINWSSLHHVIPALLAYLFTDSFLLVDDRSAPLQSEDGVQHAAPLATTSFCVAIHPKVEECGKALDVTYGAARFNADDVYFVGLPEHVWPAHHAFRTSIKASMGLEVRFDKMHAYNADMEAARREAPVDVEWPELDGHRGIPVLNLPLGSPGYVHAYMSGKAEVLKRSYAATVREAWGHLHAATAGHLSDADALVVERQEEAASGSQNELTAFLDQANSSRLRIRVGTLPVTCMVQILFGQLGAASGMWTVAIPTARTVMTPHELREIAAGYIFLPSPCLPSVVGSQILLPST
eukprot:jgi/Tetstr1/444272/TSEL_032164.t1